jgi:polar amino acid transport system substrate-binding protein
MRRVSLLLLVAAVFFAAAGWTAAAKRSPATTASSCAKASLRLVHPGQLTVGTDNPAYPPWYAGGTPKGSQWKLNDPSTGKGFEPAIAYAVARQLGFARTEVQWIYVPFAKSYAPGKKPFDFDINQIS